MSMRLEACTSLGVCCSLTVGGFLSGERLAVLVIVGGDHRHLVERLRSQTLEHGAGYISWHRRLPGLLREQRLPLNPVRLHVTRCRRPRRHEAGVSHVAGHQVFRRTHL